MENIGNAVRLMDLLKKRYLQIEYLGKANQLDTGTLKKSCDSVSTMDDLINRLNSSLKYPDDFIPPPIRDFLDKGDYEVYTDDKYGNVCWNEIEVPSFVQYYFDIFQKLIGCQAKNGLHYELQLYDLYPNSLYFDSPEELNNIVGEEDLSPFTVFKNENHCSVELYCG